MAADTWTVMRITDVAVKCVELTMSRYNTELAKKISMVKHRSIVQFRVNRASNVCFDELTITSKKSLFEKRLHYSQLQYIIVLQVLIEHSSSLSNMHLSKLGPEYQLGIIVYGFVRDLFRVILFSMERKRFHGILTCIS